MPERVEITGPSEERYVEILSPRALELLVMLHDALADRRAEALAARRRRQVQLSGGAMLDFLHEKRSLVRIFKSLWGKFIHAGSVLVDRMDNPIKTMGERPVWH